MVRGALQLPQHLHVCMVRTIVHYYFNNVKLVNEHERDLFGRVGECQIQSCDMKYS